MLDLVNVLDCNMPGETETIAVVVRSVVNIIKIIIPILLIIWGMLDLGKAVIAQKEDEIKKGQQTFIKRLIAAVIVFFIVVIVQVIVGIVATDTDQANVKDCINCFINSTDKCSWNSPKPQ